MFILWNYYLFFSSRILDLLIDQFLVGVILILEKKDIFFPLQVYLKSNNVIRYDNGLKLETYLKNIGAKYIIY